MPLLSWLLNCIYALVLLAAAPWLVWRSVRTGRYRAGWSEKLFGRLPESEPGERVIWFHAVSVGEVLQLETIVPRVASAMPGAVILITSTTSTGLLVARERFPEHRCHYFPLDFSWSVKNALQRVRPEMIVLVELEVWPNFILHASRRGVRLALINARISVSSFRGYSRIRPLITRVLGCLDVVGAQTLEYAERLRQLGAADPVVTGSIKFDRVRSDRGHPATLGLRAALGIRDNEILLIAGSTQAPEEQMALSAWQQLRSEFPQLRLIVVPRHRERFDDVASLIRASGEKLLRRSNARGNDLATAADSADRPVILLDTLGELRDCWGLADIAFVGGSFGDRGGQNMIEPAGYGAAVLFGPNTVNFQDVVDRLLDEEAAIVVPTTDRFTDCVRTLLNDLPAARRIGESAGRIVRAQSGASDRTLKLLWSPSVGAVGGSDPDCSKAA